MTKFYLCVSRYLTVFLLLLASSAFAQKTVSGKITASDDGSGLPGVNILEKGTTNGTVSDAEGNFTITASDNATLVFSFIGYKGQEISIGAQSTINVSLAPDVTSLTEIVVVGYGQQEKKDVTGSLAVVDSKNFNRGIMSSPQDMLVGKVAGVQVTSNDGAPGAGSTIKIRGTNSLSGGVDPLIVIDGFPVDNSASGSKVPGVSNPLTLINPNDIESFTVLKDASATAIYGLRAANGVIIITTKKGKSGKPQWNLNSTVSVSSPLKYFDVLSGDQLRTAAADQLALGRLGLTQQAIDERIGSANTDWQKQVYRNAVSTDHNLSVSGAYKNMPYRVSYGFTDQEGLLKSTSLVRNSLNINLSPSFLNDDLTMAISFKGSNTHNDFGNTGAVGGAIVYDPGQPVKNGNIRWGGYTTWTATGTDLLEGNANTIAPANPVAQINQSYNTSIANRGIGTLKVDYRLPFLRDLKVTANGGFDYSKSSGHNNNPLYAPFANGGFGSQINYSGTNRSVLLDLYGTYTKTIDRHKLDVTAGYSYQNFEIKSTNFSRNGDPNTPSTQWPDATIPKDENNNDVLGSDGMPLHLTHDAVPQYNTLLSFFGRANYSYDDKYLLSVSFRDDASSRFAKENQWHVFPSVAAGWKIKNESFMSSVPVISDLKLRGSYGVTGNQNITVGSTQNGSYPYLGLYQQGVANTQYVFGSGHVVTQRPQAYDKPLKWETTAQADIGLDFGFFGNRLTGTFDYYNKKTSDLLSQIPIAIGSNFSNSLTTNVGNMTNKGFEVSLRGVAVKTNDLEWSIGANFAHNDNKVTKLLRNEDPNSIGNPVTGISGGLGGTIQNQQVGYPINAFFVYEQIYDSQGKPVEGLYKDVSGNGGDVTASNLNKIRFHSPNPTALIGLNTSLRYKSFDFYASGRVILGNWVYNNNASSKAYYGNLYYPSGFFNNLPSSIYDTNFLNQQLYSSYYVQNASFFKMDNISLGYTAKRLVTDRLKARFSLTVQNAFFITKYKGVDPETNNGVDNNIYPRPRTVMLGMNLTF